MAQSPPLPRGKLAFPLALNASTVVAAMGGASTMTMGLAVAAGLALLWASHSSRTRSLGWNPAPLLGHRLHYQAWLDARNGALAAIDIVGDGEAAASPAALLTRALAEGLPSDSLMIGVPVSAAQLRDTKAIATWLEEMEGIADRVSLLIPAFAATRRAQCRKSLALIRNAGVAIRFTGRGRRRHGDNVMLAGTMAQDRLIVETEAAHRGGGHVYVGGISTNGAEQMALQAGCDFVSGSYYFPVMNAQQLGAMLPASLRHSAAPEQPNRRKPVGGVLISREDRRLMNDLRAGFDNGEVSLHYQPKMKCRTNEVDSAEALIRWQHPERGAVGPAHFIPLSERNGDIVDLTWWTLERAATDQKNLIEQGIPLDISINISAGLISDPNFISEAIRRLERRAGTIAFEITETAIIDDPTAALAGLARLVEAGIDLSIDDYGAGMSSLTYLKRVPAKELKIDRLFSAELTKSHNDPMLMRSSIDLAHGLGMEVTAEGIETQAALALLRVMGCDRVQGYLTGKPMPLAEFAHYVRNREHLTALDAAPLGFRPAANFW
ncbi:EAL domain-containing protein [Pacificimonas sp. ICDLI1SI03]